MRKTAQTQEKLPVDTRAPQSAGRNAPVSRGAKSHGEARLEIPVGEPDLPALRSIMREWLVPRLVEDFLLKRGIELKYSRAQTNSGKKTNSEY